MSELIAQFHWLRPPWLLGIIPAIVAAFLLWRQTKNATQWRSVIAPQFLHYLLDGQISSRARWQFIALMAGWVLACLALAGPTWQQIPQPVHRNEAAVVIVWDLSPSVVAEDLKPSRLVRARHKLTDFLSARQEGYTALVAYAGEAHVVSPLTDDNDTIINLLPALHPGMMPLAGSNVEMGVDLALQLFADSSIRSGDILVVTDEITPRAQETLRNKLADSSYRLSIFGIGTADGAPIPAGGGGFAKDQYGNIVIAKLNGVELRQLAANLNGHYVDIQADDSDVDYLLAVTQQALPNNEQLRLLEKNFDTWKDFGQVLALLLLPIVALAFRRGLVLPILVGAVLLPQRSDALEWMDLWLRKDQQAQQIFNNGDAASAAEVFRAPEWQGSARYRSDNFNGAAESFDSALQQNANAPGTEKADLLYNRGNALAKAGLLEQALDAYEQALEQQPEMEDAQFNRDLVKQLLEQQNQSDNNMSSQNDQQNSEQQQSQQQDNQQSQNQQNANQNNSENQEQNQQAGQDSQQSQSQQQNQQSQNQENQQESQSGDDSQTEVDEELAQQLADREQEQTTQDQLDQLQQQMEREPLTEEQMQQLAAAEQSDSEQQEQEQAMQQWLRQIPDDPSGLLRRKFEYQHRQLRRRYQTGEWELPSNGATQRW